MSRWFQVGGRVCPITGSQRLTNEQTKIIAESILVSHGKVLLEEESTAAGSLCRPEDGMHTDGAAAEGVVATGAATDGHQSNRCATESNPANGAASERKEANRQTAEGANARARPPNANQPVAMSPNAKMPRA